jgi:uncharacterized protein (DUF433 family)
MSVSTERRFVATTYPHIVQTENGEPVIEGTRVAVRHIVGYHYRAGLSVEEILRDLPHLKPAQVFSALAYYHDHQSEIDRLSYLNSYECWVKQHGQRATHPAKTVSE